MRFPLCITVDNSFLIAVVHSNASEYMVAADILRYETCERYFLADGRPIKKIRVLTDINGLKYFGISITDVYSNLSREYINDDTIILNISSSDLDFKDLVTSVTKDNSVVLEIDELLKCVCNLGDEIYKESECITKNGKPICPLINSSRRTLTFEEADGVECRVNLKPVITTYPEDEVYLPIPTTSDIIRANKVSFEEDDALVVIPKTSEFGSENEREEYIEDTIRRSQEELVVQDIQTYINPWYHLEKIFANMNIPEAEKENRMEFAKQCDGSIYRQNNLRVLGVPVEPSSDNYKLLFGKGDYNTDFYSNELRFKDALENLLNSVLLYEHHCYSIKQLINKKAGPVRSEWFDNWAVEQIKVILQYMYAYTGKVAPSFSGPEGDEDDDDDDENRADLTVSSGTQLLKVAKNELNKFIIVAPDELEYTQKVRNHELEVDTGYQNCKWYINGINNPESCIYAIIQLLRLGEHKCQYLKVPSLDESEATPYFDTKQLCQVKAIVIERAFEAVLTQLGKEYSVLGGVYITRKIDGSSVDLPIAIVLGKEETNGVTSRIRKVVLDTNKFINDAINLRKDKKPILSIDGFDFENGTLVYDENMLEQSLNERISPYELDIESRSDDKSVIVDQRMSKGQYDKLIMFCKEAGLPAPTIVDNKYTMLLALSKVETGELEYSVSAKVSLRSDAREDYVLQKVAKMYLENIIKNQSQMEISKRKVSITTLINYVLKHNAADEVVTQDGKSVFDVMLTDTQNFTLLYQVYIVNSKDDVIGYAYQVANKRKEMTLLVSSKREIGLRLFTCSSKPKKLNVAKIMSMRCIDKFYESSNLEEQLKLVLSQHRVALDSINTVKLLREDA